MRAVRSLSKLFSPALLVSALIACRRHEVTPGRAPAPSAAISAAPHLEKVGTMACDGAVNGLVLSTKEAMDLLNGPTDPDAGHFGNGTRVEADDWPFYGVAVYENHPDHWATLAWFHVDVSKGTVKTDDDKTLSVDPKLAAVVRRSCARK